MIGDERDRVFDRRSSLDREEPPVSTTRGLFSFDHFGSIIERIFQLIRRYRYVPDTILPSKSRPIRPRFARPAVGAVTRGPNDGTGTFIIVALHIAGEWRVRTDHLHAG